MRNEMMKRFCWALTLMCCSTLMLLSTGCPVAVDPPPTQTVDTDGDGVIDDDDLCPDTPANETANDVGCSDSQMNNDTDGDGVNDPDDQCPDTPAGDVVDVDGCTITVPSRDDRDGDGVPDEDDICLNTPIGNVVDQNGCTIVTGGGGGGGGSVCGNGVREGDEVCDTGGASATCDANCQLIVSPGTFTADNCADATTVIGEGAFVMNNTAATLDGPGHATCARVGFGEDQIDLDVWAIWTSPCTATVFVQTCGLTAVDTRIAVYDGGACPSADESLLDCNDDRCDLQSQVTFEAITGQDYLIRVGTFPGEPGGTGSVSITCGINACPGTGDCLAANGSVGCDDESCCETVCNVDPFCCDNEWDDVCALEADGLCSGSFDSCVAGAGDCSIALELVCRGGLRDTLICVDDSNCPEGVCVIPPPGCGDVDCCNAVCLDDPFCCINTWDEFCVAAEPATCFLTCGAGSGDCFSARADGSDQAGCDDVACCEQVCPRDIFCCGVEWDQTCVDKALIFCTP